MVGHRRSGVDQLSRTPEAGVVVGVNGSGPALRAVRWAAAEAHRRGVPLRIVHGAPYALGNPLDEQRAASILALAHAVATHAQPRVPTHTECVVDRPARMLTAAAETARLLVVGMGGWSRCDGGVVRSLALDVCAAAACPVVVVRGPAGPMSTDGPVVLGLDDIGRDAAAITAALADADGPATRLVVVHALHGPDAMFDAVATHAQPRVPTRTECVFERPARMLTAAAESAGLLVVGMGGGSRCDGGVVRSLVLDVCAAASCPVVVVRGPAGPMSTDRPAVLGLDGVGRDAAAITAAFTDADGTATRLVVVHAAGGTDAMLDTVSGHPASARAVAEEEITTALAPWRSRHPGVSVEVRVVPGTPSGPLLEAAAPARLLVVGTAAGGPAARLVLGSTSRAVVRSSPCPVMVVPRMLDPEAQDTARPVVDTAVTAPASWGLRPHDRSELW